MKNLAILIALAFVLVFQSHAQYNPLYLNQGSDLSKSIYINSTGSNGSQPEMFFHLPYVGTSGNAIFNWDADDSGSRSAIYRFMASGDNILEFKAWNDGKNSELWFGDENNDKFVIMDNGSVGIGTSTPSYQLDVQKALASDNQYETVTRIVGYRGSSNYQKPMITLATKRGSNAPIELGGIAAYYEGNSEGGLQFLTNENNVLTPNMTINKNGKVGIGTTDFSGDDHKLRVEGSIGAREIKVQASGWSDFVFDENYELRALGEVEQHIHENGHLPEIPSEEEVLEEGINLGEMNAKLLQKIEELTLYLIQQNKQNIEQQERIEELEKVNALLLEKFEIDGN